MPDPFYMFFSQPQLSVLPLLGSPFLPIAAQETLDYSVAVRLRCYLVDWQQKFAVTKNEHNFTIL